METSEQDDLQPFYGPFMQKLGELSAQYELEKAALEQSLIRSLHETQAGASQTIIDQKASARHYMNVVAEFYERLRGIIMEGLLTRREAEKRFASKLLDITKAEHDQIISELRSEDRKKIAFAKLENEKKLDNCRLAVKIDLAGMLLQQRAELDRIRNEEIRALKQSWESEKLGHALKLKELEEQIRIQERKAAEERIERNRAVRDFTEELDQRKAEFEKVNSAHQRLKANERELREDYQALTIEYDALKEDMRASEDEFSSQINALKQIIFQREQQASTWEEKYSEKCEEISKSQGETEEFKERIESLTSEIATLKDEKRQLEQDVSDLEHDFGVLSRMLDSEKAERRTDAKQLQLTIREQQDQLSEQQQRLAALDEAMTAATAREGVLQAAASSAEAERDRAVAALARLRAEVNVWLLDAICLRFDKPVDFDYDGRAPIEESDAEHIRYTEHKDLYYLICILADDGYEYRGSDARVEVSHLTFLAGLNEQARSSPRREPGPEMSGFGGEAETGVEVADSGRSGVEEDHESVSAAPSARSTSSRVAASTTRSRASSAHLTGRRTDTPSGPSAQRPSTGGGENSASADEFERLREAHSGSEERVREWKAKCIALAQRLERLEAELAAPRPADVEKIQQLEGQVKALVWALKEASGGKETAKALPPMRRTSKIL